MEKKRYGINNATPSQIHFIKELKEELKHLGITIDNFSRSVYLPLPKGKSIMRLDSFFEPETLIEIKNRYGVELNQTQEP